MRYEITEYDADVEIRIQQTGERTPQLLASLQDCHQGRCGCPTDQYDRLEDMIVDAEADHLTIRLQPRAGQHLDTARTPERVTSRHVVPETQGWERSDDLRASGSPRAARG